MTDPTRPWREPEIDHPTPEPVLQVYVAGGCGSCRRAEELVAQLLLRHPGAAVEVVDLSRSPAGRTLPAGLVGTPTYTVDGRVRWLGNPSPEELLDLVERRHG
ncbi:glutaredoxin family protein [Blastococcus capsensis]|uniref:glutaredoxin family protein n=1 Tax=Blastococcus capsensis TaxID=1564163 RepID=UPI0025403E75|nr:thioredoxin family protein [Blastococcus capsensis]MDK3256731.1 thioredoxin family protein [Blastococcus capsensis]